MKRIFIFLLALTGCTAYTTDVVIIENAGLNKGGGTVVQSNARYWYEVSSHEYFVRIYSNQKYNVGDTLRFIK